MGSLNPYRDFGLANVLAPGSNLGKIIYVNGLSGDADHSGFAVDEPLLTITAALALCTSDENDTIVVLDYWSPATETFPISVNKTGVTIVGAKGGSYASYVAMTPLSTTAIFDIAAGNVRIMGLYLQGNASAAGITFTGGNQRIGIYGCYFSAGTYGIYTTNNNPGAWLTIGDCTFASPLSSGGIEIANQAWFRIHDCVFNQVTGVAINVGGAGGGQILDNKIATDSDVAGRAITLGTATTTMVDGNSAGYGEAQAALNNPYLDNTATDTNFWGHNWWCEDLTAPG